MEDCIKVSSREGSSAVFVDVEEDGSLLLETLKAQFDTMQRDRFALSFLRKLPIC